MVYVLLADGFEEVEAIEPIDIMRRAGIEVKTVSIMKDNQVRGSHGITVTADMMINNVEADKMDMVMLPGGGLGHELLDASNEVHALINDAVANGKYIAAICAAPSILGKKQLLSGKKATCYPGYENYLYGAQYSTDKTIVDGNYITARGAGAAAEFGFEIVTLLKSRAVADKVKEVMQY